ncbi:hypothetical protein GCM10022398_24970 [Acetobacter lovaniensis]|nr:hypothetical protein AA0474_0207 [Acetobacter lovaniensis NRIC 0474]
MWVGKMGKKNAGQENQVSSQRRRQRTICDKRALALYTTEPSRGKSTDQQLVHYRVRECPII